MGQHTPGPWTVNDGEIVGGGFVLGMVYGAISDVGSDHECHANARLIAAAPDLLAALKAMMDVQDSTDDCWCDDGVRPCEACQCRAAIAKVEGGVL